MKSLDVYIKNTKLKVLEQSHNSEIHLVMMNDLKAELDSYTHKGILAQVDSPSAWISNNVAMRKPNRPLQVFSIYRT